MVSAVKIRAESEFTFDTPLTVEQVREIVADAVGRFADEHPSVLDFEVFLGAPGNIGIKILLSTDGFEDAEETIRQLGEELSAEIYVSLRHTIQSRATELIPA